MIILKFILGVLLGLMGVIIIILIGLAIDAWDNPDFDPYL